MDRNAWLLVIVFAVSQVVMYKSVSFKYIWSWNSRAWCFPGKVQSWLIWTPPALVTTYLRSSRATLASSSASFQPPSASSLPPSWTSSGRRRRQLSAFSTSAPGSSLFFALCWQKEPSWWQTMPSSSLCSLVFLSLASASPQLVLQSPLSFVSTFADLSQKKILVNFP